jgi:hypothetical protein
MKTPPNRIDTYGNTRIAYCHDTTSNYWYAMVVNGSIDSGYASNVLYSTRPYKTKRSAINAAQKWVDGHVMAAAPLDYDEMERLVNSYGIRDVLRELAKVCRDKGREFNGYGWLGWKINPWDHIASEIGKCLQRVR